MFFKTIAMKKVVIFVHGEVFPEFTENHSLHKKYETVAKKRILWKLINGHLNKDDQNFIKLLRELQNADIFLCDSDNTNLEGEIEDLNFESNCYASLINALGQIKKRNPRLKIFIKIFPYSLKKEIENLSRYGKIIHSWFNEKILYELKK